MLHTSHPPEKLRELRRRASPADSGLQLENSGTGPRYSFLNQQIAATP